MNIRTPLLFFVVVLLAVGITSACSYERGYHTVIEIRSSINDTPIENATVAVTPIIDGNEMSLIGSLYGISYDYNSTFASQGMRTNKMGDTVFVFYTGVKYRIDVKGDHTVDLYPEEPKYIIWV